MRNKWDVVLVILAVVTVAILVASCPSDADVVSHNISKDADQFRIYRRIVFYNGITDQYILTIEGFCSLGNYDPDDELSVVCKTDTGFVKHFLGLSDNVTYFAQQIEPAHVSDDRYKVIFKPSSVIPDIEQR